MFIDSHAHVLKENYSDINSFINNAKKNKVNKIVNCATCINDFDELIDLSKKYGLFFTLGIHPDQSNGKLKNYFDILEKYIKQQLKNKYFLAIGEIGLDFYYLKNKEEQIKLFETQLALAQKYNLPVIIHSRDATLETLMCLKKYKLKGIIHCFTGSYETAVEYNKLGYKLGIGGVITFKNCNLKDYIRDIGIENIVLETDCPYMTPEPFRKYTNESAYISEISRFLSKVFEISMEEVGNITTQNCNEIFDFNK